jgi:hypothetical protein
VGVGDSAPDGIVHARQDVTSGNYQARLYVQNTDQKTFIGSYWRTGVGQYSVIQSTNDAESVPGVLLLNPSGGNVAIGTTSPSNNLHISGTGLVRANIESTSSNNADILFTTAGTLRGTMGYSSTVGGLNIDYGRGTGPLTFSFVGSEVARIDSSGRLLVGTSTARSNFESINSAGLQVESAGGALGKNISCTSNFNGTFGQANVIFAKTRGTTLGSATAVQSGDYLGTVSFLGSDGTNFINAAEIKAAVDGTPGTNDMPGRLVFSTTADGAASPTERMRITSTGAVTVGGTSTDPVGASASQVLACGPGASQGAINYYNSSNICLKIGRGDNGALVTFFRNQPAVTQVGNISVTTTATAYNTSSDYRLKENVTTVSDGITRLQQLKPSRFNFIADPDNTVDGFLAHEVQTVVPEAISGEKDAVDDDGNPVYQGIDQSKLVPLLTAALQEAIGEIESLKARLDAANL